MSLLPPILEGRISNFHQIWEGFLVILPKKFLQIPLVKIESTVFSSGDVNLSSGVSTFCKKENEKSKFSVDFWLYNGLSMSYVSIVP